MPQLFLRRGTNRRFQAYSYSTGSIHSVILRLFEKYVSILETKFGKRFESVRGDYLTCAFYTDIERRSSRKTTSSLCMWRRHPRKTMCLRPFGSHENNGSSSNSTLWRLRCCGAARLIGFLGALHQ